DGSLRNTVGIRKRTQAMPCSKLLAVKSVGGGDNENRFIACSLKIYDCFVKKHHGSQKSPISSSSSRFTTRLVPNRTHVGKLYHANRPSTREAGRELRSISWTKLCF